MYFSFSRERSDIRSFNQGVVGGGVGHFQSSKMHLLATREANVITSAYCFERGEENTDTPKMATIGHGGREICKAPERKSEKEAQYEAN